MATSGAGFAALLIFGVLLMIGGGTGLAFSDPFSDPAIWYALVGIGFLMLIGGIIYLVALQVKTPVRS